VQIIACEMPLYDDLAHFIKAVNGPVSPSEIGISPEEVKESLFASMEIRDKYIGSRLLWDLGLLDEMGERLQKYVEELK
jgi:glycerol-1-phosphate dehydrogenase [NAD(P)+]